VRAPIGAAFASGIFAIALLVSSAQPAYAIDEAPAWAYAMAHDLMSPYCPGRTLAECPSPQATELRFWILTQGAAGASKAEVRGMLSDRFGDILLSAPKAEGWGFSAYAVPIVFFLLGGPVVVLVLRRLSSGGAGVAAMTPALTTPAIADEELERQLERELGEL
jgi:cytochrome c-type biogenesis protein CcmH/NrfF